jgi:hypothetical protein
VRTIINHTLLVEAVSGMYVLDTMHGKLCSYAVNRVWCMCVSAALFFQLSASCFLNVDALHVLPRMAREEIARALLENCMLYFMIDLRWGRH